MNSLDTSALPARKHLFSTNPQPVLGMLSIVLTLLAVLMAIKGWKLLFARHRLHPSGK
ncbi:MAG: hypothetical protein JXA62_07565 [Candidatus Aminicenantes bacterium]|nr:hypothetical protein [Candidatus Aminicenantes bacterium]